MNVAFEGDTFIKGELVKLRDKFGLENCIETGTQYGSTALELKTIFQNVTTIEADEKYFELAKENLLGTKVNLVFGKSEIVLWRYIQDNALYYFDAHGCDIGGCPLKAELATLARMYPNNICIAIHDFKVPGKDFGYDTYDYELCYEQIEPYLGKIYPRGGYEYFYNEQADGARRGIIFIYPKNKNANTN